MRKVKLIVHETFQGKRKSEDVFAAVFLSNAAGGPGCTIFSYKGSLGKFRIDWDPSHGFHCHPPGH